MRYAEVNGESQNRCVQGMGEFVERKNRTGKACPAKERNMEVFGNDFATVYFREELCYHSCPEKTKLREGELYGKMVFLRGFKEIQKIFYKSQHACELTV